MVNFAEINNIGENVTYIRTTPFSAILWHFRAQTILWRRQFQREIYSYAIIYLSLFKHLRLSWLPLFFEAPHIRIFNKVSSSGLTVRLCLLCFDVYEIWILIMFPLSSVKWYKFTKLSAMALSEKIFGKCIKCCCMYILYVRSVNPTSALSFVILHQCKLSAVLPFVSHCFIVHFLVYFLDRSFTCKLKTSAWKYF